MPNRNRILKPISHIYWIEKSGDGLTAGLYLSVYAEMFKSALINTTARDELVSAAGISASAETWAVGLLVPITLLIAMLEVPSGYLADWRGPRFAVTASWVFRSLFFAVFYSALSLADSTDVIVKLAYVATIPFSIGYTLRSGANQTWLHWALAHYRLSAVEIEEYRNSINSRSWTFYWIASLIGGLFSILLYKIAPAVVFGAGFAASLSLAIFLRWRMKDYAAIDESSEEDEIAGFDHWQLAARWTTLIVVAGAAGVFMILADLVDHTWLIVSRAYLEHEVTALHESMLVCATGVAAILGSGIPTWIDSKTESYSSFRSVLLFAIVAAAFGAPHFIFGQYPGFTTLMLFLFAKDLIRGAFDGPKENLVNGLIPSRNKYRATLISGVNQAGNLMVAFVAIYFFVADKRDGESKRLIATWGAFGAALVMSAFSVLAVAIWAATIYRPRSSGEAMPPFDGDND